MMSFQERIPLTVVGLSTLLYAGFIWRMRAAADAGRFEGAEGLVYTGKSLLTFVGLFVVLTILTLIGQAIFEAIRTGEEDVDTGEDERDRAYEFRSLRIQSGVTGVAFCAAMGALWAGYSAPLAIHVLFFGMYFGMVLGELRKFCLYRAG